jgi:hypothetical protein
LPAHNTTRKDTEMSEQYDPGHCVDTALASREVGESVADALTRVGDEAERQMAEFAALAEELTELYGPDADAMADCILDGLLAYAEAWDARPGTPATCPVFVVGDLVEITDPALATCGMTGVVTKGGTDGYEISLGGGFSTVVPASALRLSLRRFADVPERVRELASRGPAEMFTRFNVTFLGDGSQWDRHDDGRLTLAYPPYRYPRVVAVLAGTAAEVIEQING